MKTRRLAPALFATTGLGAAALLWVQRRYLVATVEGPSMEPTLFPGDRLLVRRTGRVRAGQVVVVRVPHPPVVAGLPPGLRGLPPNALAAVPERTDLAPAPHGRLMVKRAVAVAGDPVPVDRFPVLRDAAGQPVPAHAIVVLGDNAASSWDSRAYGFVHRDQVVGVAVRRIAPPGGPRTSRAGLVWEAPTDENRSGSETGAPDGERRGT
ncbi:S26 family signal peptidase [Embleya sp. NPDC008237]|uniref:S26 family signal peptidase n=1 Tax=Embleya sp. NPDC008237 TaxID=3363978 RepID=UPI0036E9F54A